MVLSRYNDARNAWEDFAVKTSGQQFGMASSLQGGAAAGAVGGAGGGAALAAAGSVPGSAFDKKRSYTAKCVQVRLLVCVYVGKVLMGGGKRGSVSFIHCSHCHMWSSAMLRLPCSVGESVCLSVW